MKKLISVITLSFTLFCGSLFAESNSGCSAGDNLFIFEVTGAAIGFGFNEVVTYDHMFSENFGVGGGVALTEGLAGTVDGFVDFKLRKWNLGIGGGYSYATSSSSFLLRGVYHGNSWDWGKMKAGWTIGSDWHLYNGAGNDNIGAVLGLIPRFVLGVNAQLK